MYKYNNYNLNMKSDFEIRELHNFEDDIDLIVDTNRSVVNLILEELPEYIDSRFQFTEVNHILFRISKNQDINLCTIHFLRVIDLNSSLMNFVLDISKTRIEINKSQYQINMEIKNNLK